MITITAYIKPVHVTYLILKIDVKSWSRKMGILVNKKGKSMWMNHPFKLRYNLDIQSGFGSCFYQIMAVKLQLPFLTKRWISQVLAGWKFWRYVWNINGFVERLFKWFLQIVQKVFPLWLVYSICKKLGLEIVVIYRSRYR